MPETVEVNSLTYRPDGQQKWLWLTLTLSCVTIAAVVFSVWELLENRFFRHVDYLTFHYLYITRGVVSSLLLAFWAAWYVVRHRRRAEEALRLSRERYRSLLELSPGAVALYDDSLRVAEWNAAAERLYGLSKAEVLGEMLPTVPPEKQDELRGLLARVSAGETILDVITVRRDKSGASFEVELSLLPFREPAGQDCFLEVTADIRDRIRLREKILEVEKLTSMGRMAAGTAHHLNTPLAAMSLRVQMMRDRRTTDMIGRDLDHLESGIRFCQHFVQRLLQFSRPAPAHKQPVALAALVEGVVSFLAPSVLAKRASVNLDLGRAGNVRVRADRNLLEAMFHILLSNSLDAIQPGGTIVVGCLKPSADWVEVRVKDNGCGVSETDLARIFEPFFSTKGPGKGTGLGLAIARNIAIEHGGSIRLESVPGEGTAAVVQLPCHEYTTSNEEVTSLKHQ